LDRNISSFQQNLRRPNGHKVEILAVGQNFVISNSR
jgi:hypothetical protein